MAGNTQELLLKIEGLHKRFGDNVVLESISLSFEEGQLNGIMGPNGEATRVELKYGD